MKTPFNTVKEKLFAGKQTLMFHKKKFNKVSNEKSVNLYGIFSCNVYLKNSINFSNIFLPYTSILGINP